MAKKVRSSPAGEFIRNSADIIKQLLTSMYVPIARLASDDAYVAAQDRISTLMNVPATAFSPDDFRQSLVNIGNVLKAATSSNDYVSKFKKDRNGYTFTFNRKASQGGELEFNTLIEIFPGVTVRGFRTNTSETDKLSVIYAMMSAAGFNFTPQEGKFIATYAPVVIGNDPASKRKLAQLTEEEITIPKGVDSSGIAGLIDKIETISNSIHRQPMMNAAFQAVIRYEVEVSSFGSDVSLAIRPSFDITLSETLVPYMAETNDKSANDYLVYAWMNNALDRATARARSTTKNLPAVDLRITSAKLKATADKFQVAKPRLNEYGFCINGNGLPMFVPKIDSTAKFMQQHSNFKVGEDGYLNYEDVAVEWANTIVLVDWFNDVIVYTQVNGKLAVYRLLGYIPLDKASEYVFLNTSVSSTDTNIISMLKNLCSVVDSVVSNTEAENFLEAENRTATSYNAGRIRNTFTGLMNDIRSGVAMSGGKMQPLDNDYQYDSYYSAVIKHIFGIDLEELPVSARGPCMQAAAYLRAAAQHRKDITMAIRDRLVGIEYFLIMAPKMTPDKFKEVRTAARAEFDKRKNAPRLLSEIDVPNIDAGGNIKGFMPHQVKVISDLSSGATDSLVGVSAGGGKTILQLVDVIMKIRDNPTWRPLIVTKPSLVKGFISEVNFFTKGKMNIVSIRMSQIRHVMKTLRITTAEGLVKWVKSFPPNTIFICGYTDFASSSTLFDDLEVPERVMLEDVGLPQFMHILRIIGFDVVRLDESHSIKNMASKRSRFAYAALAQAKSKQLLSGTIVNNTAVDLIGQAYGINPMAFGRDIDAFKDTYNLPSGLIKSDESSQRINMRLRKFTQMSSATKEDWSFILPDLYDKTIAPAMTPKQAQFYQLLMKEAEVELRAAMKKEDKTGNTEDDDDEEDNDAYFQMKADASLAKAEQFLVSPDTNEQYLTWKEQPTGDDLVSPMVRGIDAELAKIYADRGADHSNNKSAVFGIHKVASVHFMKHTKFKDLCLHYKAGDSEVLRQFKANPDKYILVADSTSLREGENLQLLSYIYDMQCLPGDSYVLIDKNTAVTMEEIYNNDEITHVLAYDFKTKKIGKKAITAKLRQPLQAKDDVIQITVRDTETGKKGSMVVTGNHTLILKGNKEIAARDIERGAIMYTYGGKFDTKHSIDGVLYGKDDYKNQTSLKGATSLHKRRASDPVLDLQIRDASRKYASSLSVEERKRRGRLLSATVADKMLNPEYAAHISKIKSKVAKTYWDSMSAEDRALVLARIDETRKASIAAILEKDPDYYFKIAAKKDWKKQSEAMIAWHAKMSVAEKARRRGLMAEGARSYAKYHAAQVLAVYQGWSVEDHIYRLYDQYEGDIYQAFLDDSYYVFVKTLIKILRDNKGDFSKNQRSYAKYLRKEYAEYLSTVKSFAGKAVWASLSTKDRKTRLSAMLMAHTNGMPNKPEQAVIDADIDNLEYTGGGDFWVRFKDGTCKNPDFVRIVRTKHGKQRKVVEIIGNRKFTGRDANDYDQRLINKYAEVGVDCLVVDAEDAFSEATYESIDRFVNNHYVEVTAVHKISDPNTREKKFGKYKYDISVEGAANFFTVAKDYASGSKWSSTQNQIPVLVHNCTWTPGDYEQLISRMYRPDPKGQYNKDSVIHYWVAPTHKNNDPSLSSVKLARMISKAISMARFKYEGDPRWNEISYHFDGLDLLTMNFDTIFNSTHNSLAPYFNAWTRFVKWERENNQATRKKVAQDIEAENPGIRLIDAQGNVLDRNLFTKMVMREAKSTTTLPNSKRVYTPWERQAVPADIHDMSLTILGTDEVERGAYVLTEFGPGIVHGWTDNQVIVELVGRKRAKVDRERVAIPNGEGVAKMNAIINNPSAWAAESYLQVTNLMATIDLEASLAPKAGRNIKVKQPPLVTDPIDITAPTPKVSIKALKKPEPEEEELHPIEEIYTYIINGMPALALLDAPSGVENLGWVSVAPFYRISFASWAVADKFLVSMAKKFAIQKSKMDLLQSEMDEFRTGKSMRLQKRVTDTQARNFFLQNHRKLSTANDGRDRVDPYWLAIDKNIYLAFSTVSHSPRVFTWLNTMAAKNAPNIKKPSRVGEMYINVFNTLAEAAADLRELGKAFNINEAEIRQELRELKEDIQALRGVRARPLVSTRK